MFSLQLAQNLSDNLVSMATADATVRATMASLEETNNENMPSEPLVVVHSREEVANNNNRTADMNQPTVRPSVGGAEGGQDNSNVGEHAETDNKKHESQTRGSPTNPMSVSVPNLPTSMEQTVNLLETFAAVARRNLGTVSMNNRCNSIRLNPANLQSKCYYEFITCTFHIFMNKKI